MKVHALVPARRGSRRLPDKHLALLGGQPLIVWTFQAAKAAGVFQRITLSSDDERLRLLADESGGLHWLQRPAELAASDVGSARVVEHYLSALPATDLPDLLMLLQPTTPFRCPAQLREVARAGVEAVSLGPLAGLPVKPAEWCRRLDAAGRVRHCPPEEARWRLNGSLYLIDVSRFQREGTLLTEGVAAVLMDRRHSIDIDDRADLELARSLLDEWAVVA